MKKNYAKVECPNCLSTGEEYDRRRKQSKICHLCNGEGIVDEIIANAYIHEMIPNMDY